MTPKVKGALMKTIDELKKLTPEEMAAYLKDNDKSLSIGPLDMKDANYEAKFMPVKTWEERRDEAARKHSEVPNKFMGEDGWHFQEDESSFRMGADFGRAETVMEIVAHIKNIAETRRPASQSMRDVADLIEKHFRTGNA